ncbi:MAG: hypothetical protein GF317_04850 [Candidatus Lokiarchaeota archaeon]|nr:hypothetical protein [Candidatus Lokiarchaeota archaeon]
MQGGSLNFNYEKASLYCGSALFPSDVKYHSGSITGSASYAELTAVGFEKLIGGTRTGSAISITKNSEPEYFQLEFTVTTDSVSFVVSLVRVTSGKLSMEFVRDNYIIPEFDFEAFADSSGTVGAIFAGDVS